MTDQSSLLHSIQRGLYENTGEMAELEWIRSLTGGDINQAALIRSQNKHWFVKFRADAPIDLFATEADALNELSEAKCIRVPKPVAFGKDGETSWLVLEYLQLTRSGPSSQLGEQLAALHMVHHDRYGWKRDNYIGVTPQRNRSSDKWTEFWRDSRLMPQLELAEARGFDGSLLDKAGQLLEALGQLLDDHKPSASLLHGDLWAGNKAYTNEGQAVIFDPASYYGDRETDIAMTELFGGFEPAFYSAYQAHSPLPDGYPLRRDLYNLYHMLNHLNLFGEAYLPRCQHMINVLLAQVR